MIGKARADDPLRNRTRSRRLIDEVIERYVDWREECKAVGGAYAIWSRAPRGEGALAFAAYLAALDREECAASLYASVIDRLQCFLSLMPRERGHERDESQSRRGIG